MTSLTGRTMSGVFWTSGTAVAGQGVFFVTSAILSRILTAEDFGRMGMVLVFAGFLALFNQMGFGLALIRKETADQTDYSTVFWMNLGVGAALTALFALGGRVLADFYGEPQVEGLCHAMAFQYPLTALVLVQHNILRREMRFRLLACLTLGSLMAGATGGVVLALRGYGVWSLVGRLLIEAGVKAVLVWLFVSWRPAAVFSRASLSSMRCFSFHMLGFTVFDYWTKRSDMLLAGRFLGAGPLGVYTRAMPTYLSPLVDNPNILSQVMVPALARLVPEPERLRGAYLRALALFALGIMPLTLGLAATGDDFIRAVYGPQWDGAIPVVRVLAIVSLAHAVVGCAGWLLQAVGRADTLLRLQIVTGACQMAGLAAGIWGGSILALAIGYLAGTLVPLWPMMFLANRTVALPMRRWAASLAGAGACAALMAVAVWTLGMALPAGWGAWPRLLARVGTGAVAYAGLVTLFRLAAWTELRANLRRYGMKGIFHAS